MGVWRVAKLTIPPTVPLAIPPTVRPTILPTVTPTPLGRLPGGLPGQPTQIINPRKGEFNNRSGLL